MAELTRKINVFYGLALGAMGGLNLGLLANNQDVQIDFSPDLEALAKHDVPIANVIDEPVCDALNKQWSAYAQKHGLPDDISFECKAVQGSQQASLKPSGP